MRLLEELRQRGFTGGYTVVRQRLSELRPRVDAAPGGPLRDGAGRPGPDGLRRLRPRLHQRRPAPRLVCSATSWATRGGSTSASSRPRTSTTTLREHVRAFEHLGGVAATCLYDNMKVVVTGYEDDVPIYNPRFLAFATHYGFRPVACRPRRPQTKGKVERPFSYVETNLFNGRTFASLDHLNETTAWWLAQVADVRELREAKQDALAVA